MNRGRASFAPPSRTAGARNNSRKMSQSNTSANTGSANTSVAGSSGVTVNNNSKDRTNTNRTATPVLNAVPSGVPGQRIRGS